ncbi:MAG: P-II family nitrogen regulator [Verrucomicrobiota bacterium]|jgi:nitrogen regulatory protein P-II 1
MKMILAMISPEHLNKLLDDLDEHELPGLTVSEARGFGQQDRDFTDVELPPMLRLEIVCQDNEAERIVQSIYRSSHTGRRGDGKVFILPVLDALRIKTGERGEAAIKPRPPSCPESEISP